MIEFLKFIFTIQLFWALGITLLVATIPAAHLTPVTLFVDSSGADTLETIGPELESNLQNQVNLPLINAAALVFYSGNLIVDLVLNFFTAIPQMFTLLLEGFFMLVPNINPVVQTYFKLFVFTIISVMYFLGLISFLSKSRSGGGLI
jgi:hypothetical protein